MLPFTPTELELRFLAGAYRTEAEKSRDQAAACPPEHAANARDLIHCAEHFEKLAAKCVGNVKAVACGSAAC